MKKWLIWCLTVLAMVCLIPGIVLKAAAETVPVHCAFCGIREEREARRYEKYDSTYHRVYVTECQNCHKDGNITHLQVHSGGTQGPTCTEGKICKKCGAEYDIPGHAWGEWKPNGDGTHTRRCTNPNCDAVETGSCSGGYADCTSLGMCETCGGSYYGGHDLEQHAAKAPTCTEPGWDAYEACSRFGCDYTTRKELPALNHDLEQHAAKAPTCTEIGWDAYEACSRFGCNYTTYAEQPALNHDLEQHAAKAPTCTEKGWNAYETCSRCDYTTYVERPAQHDLEQHAAKAPTCTEKGWNAYETCKNCDYTTYAELPALKHYLVYYKAKDPTCTEPGCDAYETCSRCDHTTYVERPALKHDLRQRVIKAPTCTQMGWAYETCSRCDYSATPLLPVLNHDLKQHAAQAPTCTEIGWDAYETCSRCDYTTYAELPILGHDYQAVTVDPTCEADGYTIFTCSRCKDSYTANPTDQLGHQFGAWSPNGTGAQSADCLRCAHTGSTDCRKFTFRTAEGETLTFCPVCGQAENAAQLEMIEAATAWAISGSLSAEDVTARTNGEYLSVAFETAGSLTQPTGRVRLALPAGLLEGKTLVRIAPDGTQTEMPFETERGTIIFTLDFANSALPVMLFRLVPQTAAL